MTDKGTLKSFAAEPLVLLDGVPLFNVGKLMACNPLKVKKLDIAPYRCFQGSLAFSGIASYVTYAGNLPDFELDPRVVC
jgi:hypothetical protein